MPSPEASNFELTSSTKTFQDDYVVTDQVFECEVNRLDLDDDLESNQDTFDEVLKEFFNVKTNL